MVMASEPRLGYDTVESIYTGDDHPLRRALRRKERGWSSYEELFSTVPESELGRIEQRRDGWVRIVFDRTGHQQIVDGVLRHEFVERERYIALTQEDAVYASDGGPGRDPVPTDFHNEFCWMRNGRKPEKDHNVLQRVLSQQEEQQRSHWEDAPEHDQALMRATAAKVAAVEGVPQPRRSRRAPTEE